MIVIKGGDVLTTRGWVEADVAVADGAVTAIGSGLEGDDVIDASGSLIGPGFVDLHTHLREPGQTWKEDIATGSRAASAGGFTAIVAMPNTDPPTDSPKVVEEVRATGIGVGLVDVVPSAALTEGRMGSTPVDLQGLYEAGVRIFTDDGDSVDDAAVLKRIAAAISGLPGAMVAQHAEDVGMTGDGHMHEGSVSRNLGVGGLPAEAESEVVSRDLGIVRETGVRYHCQHVSSKTTVALIRAAKSEGLAVTAEVAPHHLSLTHDHVRDLDPNFKMYPPLRTEDDRTALVSALVDGTIDAVATDHAPHQAREKDVAFTLAPRGVIGLETAASVTWEILGNRNALFRVLSSNPARIAGLGQHGRALEPGGPANLVVFDPGCRWTVSHFESKSSNSPYLGHELQGKVRATVYQGRVTYRNGER